MYTCRNGDLNPASRMLVECSTTELPLRFYIDREPFQDLLSKLSEDISP